ncbi:armadillo repeat-containing protein 7 isoform X2 [Gorilla gorilla gorilla]
MAQKPKVDPHVGRLGYLQALVTEFQETQSQDAKEQVLANLANFAYDPSNYEYLRQLQVLDLFLDSLSEENETLVEFAIGSHCVAQTGLELLAPRNKSLVTLNRPSFHNTDSWKAPTRNANIPPSGLSHCLFVVSLSPLFPIIQKLG